MLKLNEYQYTKKGHYVFPFSVHGDVVQCFNLKGETKYYIMNDFSEKPNVTEEQNEKKVIQVQVSPIESKNTDQLYNEDEQLDDGFVKEDDTTTEDDISADTTTEDDTSADTTTTEDDTSGYVDDDSYI
jgi:hypothetical protein